jgi:phytol kinase
MADIIAALLPVGVLVLLTEALWRKKIIRGEYSRKVLHISAGVYVAFWPQIITKPQIQIVALAALASIIIVRQTKLLHSVYDIKRKSYGDIAYPLSVLAAISLAKQPWIFTVAILFLALGDGLAAVFGKLYGGNNQYKVFGQSKSLVGSFAHFLVCLAVLWWATTSLPGADALLRQNHLWYVGLPLLATVLESFTFRGLDNLTIPLFTVLVLNSFVVVTLV